MKELDEEVFLIHSCGDGQFRSDLVIGQENARLKIAEHMHFGPVEEALKCEEVKFLVDQFDDPDHWGMDRGQWLYRGEQFWIGAVRVTEAIPILRELQEAREALEKVKSAHVTALGSLHVINAYAGDIIRFMDDPNATVKDWAENIRQHRLRAHKALAAAVRGNPDADA